MNKSKKGHNRYNVKPPRPEGRGFALRAYAPGKEDKHSCIAPLDPALKDGRSALRQHFVRGEQAGQESDKLLISVTPVDPRDPDKIGRAGERSI